MSRYREAPELRRDFHNAALREWNTADSLQSGESSLPQGGFELSAVVFRPESEAPETLPNVYAASEVGKDSITTPKSEERPARKRVSRSRDVAAEPTRVLVKSRGGALKVSEIVNMANLAPLTAGRAANTYRGKFPR